MSSRPIISEHIPTLNWLSYIFLQEILVIFLRKKSCLLMMSSLISYDVHVIYEQNIALKAIASISSYLSYLFFEKKYL